MLLVSFTSPAPHHTKSIWSPNKRESSLRFCGRTSNHSDGGAYEQTCTLRFDHYTTGCFSPPSQSLATSTTPNIIGEGWLYGAAGYARAVELQRQLNVPLVVYFYTDWCPYCRSLDNQYLPATPVQDYLQGVVKVRINPEHGVTERALAKRFNVSAYPRS